MRLTSTLRTDARSAPKSCPEGSPGGSSASPPLRRRRGEEKRSLPPSRPRRRPAALATGPKERTPEGLGGYGRSVNLYGSGRPGGAGAMAFGSVDPARPRRTESSAGGHLPCGSGALPAPRADPSLLRQPLGAGIVRPAGSGLKRGRRGGSEAGGDPSPPPLQIAAVAPSPRLRLATRERAAPSLPRRTRPESLRRSVARGRRHPGFRAAPAPPRQPGHPLARSRRHRAAPGRPAPQAARPRQPGALPERWPDALWQREPGQGGRRRGTAGPTDAPPGGGQAAPARRHGSSAPASLLHPLPPAFVRLPSSAPLRFVARRFLSARAREPSAG